MKTKHESVAELLLAKIQEVAADATREDELPGECPPDGVVNLVLEAPRELGRQLGTGVREISRLALIEVVVQAANDTDRRAKLEARLVDFGGLLSGLLPSEIGVDFIDVGEPVEPEVIPMNGAASLRGITIPVELLYETSNNPMEMAQ